MQAKADGFSRSMAIYDFVIGAMIRPIPRAHAIDPAPRQISISGACIRSFADLRLKEDCKDDRVPEFLPCHWEIIMRIPRPIFSVMETGFTRERPVQAAAFDNASKGSALVDRREGPRDS